MRLTAKQCSDLVKAFQRRTSLASIGRLIAKLHGVRLRFEHLAEAEQILRDHIRKLEAQLKKVKK